MPEARRRYERLLGCSDPEYRAVRIAPDRNWPHYSGVCKRDTVYSACTTDNRCPWQTIKLHGVSVSQCVAYALLLVAVFTPAGAALGARNAQLKRVQRGAVPVRTVTLDRRKRVIQQAALVECLKPKSLSFMIALPL